ncbi:phosphatidylserine/phosphatidylglycerophosphate/cardiolipin synthase family protein [Chlamydia crocodili]|uniref:Phosphatidylserine/phosphatidylglycerophosphate/ cardiolipin synthase family protein n=1 Tax=Chlamydia crocodili TaxID=2766982 RepID=A0ABX8CD15_9CHLA|nr:phosphatidylserine/phosphatidylglycerophosphate/cardiolipin synthase family protein [Chlamydia crocodili]QVE48904.1 phosphatidylserine/phosphatidylglycerophosphate/cardiolipin synthase family protein [Chlamydia crocodili]
MNKIRWGLVIALFCSFITKDAFAFTVHFPASKEHVGVIVHDNSIEVYEKLLSAIDVAEHYVELCPCMAGGNLLEEIIEHLDRRMSEAPQLCAYILIQPTFIDSKDKQILETARVNWPDRFFYLFTGCPPGSSILAPNVIESHVKISIVDGKYIFMGGTNFEDFMCTKGDAIPEPVESSRLVIAGTQRPRAFRDQDITISSAQLGTELRKEFHAHYALWNAYAKKPWFNKNLNDFRTLSYPELTIEEAESIYCNAIEESPDLVTTDLKNIRVIFSGPDESKNMITQEYVDLINRSEKSIKIANMYFIPKDEIIESLKSACFDRGIRLEIITNGCTENSPDLTAVYAWGNRMNYFFLSYGERPSLWKKFIFSKRQPNSSFFVSEYFVRDTQLHKKCMIVDDCVFVIGSYNFGKKSDLFDYESIVVIDSPEVAQKADIVFKKDLRLSKPVDNSEIFDWYFNPVRNLMGHLQINFMPA